MPTAASAASATGSPVTAVARSYRRAAGRAGGVWNASISVAGVPAVAVGVDEVVQAYSVNKVPVAVAVLDKVDRGLLSLAQRIEVTEAIVIPGGDGIFSLDGAYPSTVTLGHALAALLTVSDDTAVRLCGLVAPALEINEILVAKGFPQTQVEPVANPNRFFLGTTTAREMHDLLNALAAGSLLSAGSTQYLLNLLRSPISFTDGIRRTMSSDERARVATKAGWFEDGRNEAGMYFDAAGSPVLTYALFARGQAHPEDFGATHPAVQARATMGREFMDAIASLSGSAPAAVRSAKYRPANGG
jgi:beta-lactamase class A